jgi:hypothetical protein
VGDGETVFDGLGTGEGALDGLGVGEGIFDGLGDGTDAGPIPVVIRSWGRLLAAVLDMKSTRSVPEAEISKL